MRCGHLVCGQRHSRSTFALTTLVRTFSDLLCCIITLFSKPLIRWPMTLVIVFNFVDVLCKKCLGHTLRKYKLRLMQILQSQWILPFDSFIVYLCFSFTLVSKSRLIEWCKNSTENLLPSNIYLKFVPVSNWNYLPWIEVL